MLAHTARALSPSLATSALSGPLLMWSLNARCHASYLTVLHLNQPDMEYSSGNADLGSEATSLGWVVPTTNLPNSAIKVYSAILVHSLTGMGLQLRAYFSNWSAFSMNDPYPTFNTGLAIYPFKAGYTLKSVPAIINLKYVGLAWTASVTTDL